MVGVRLIGSTLAVVFLRFDLLEKLEGGRCVGPVGRVRIGERVFYPSVRIGLQLHNQTLALGRDAIRSHSDQASYLIVGRSSGLQTLHDARRRFLEDALFATEASLANGRQCGIIVVRIEWTRLRRRTLTLTAMRRVSGNGCPDWHMLLLLLLEYRTF